MSTTLTPVADAIEILHEDTRGLAVCIRAEAAIAYEKTDLLERLINSLVGQTNPLTQKPHSATSAETAAKLTIEYQALRKNALDAEVATLFARSRLEASRIIAWSTVRGGE